MSERLRLLKEALEKARLDAMFLTKQANQRYLEGFTGGDCYLLASGKGSWLIADSRYSEMAQSQCRSASVRLHRHPHPPLGEVVAAIASENGFARIGFEKNHITWGLHSEVGRSETFEFVPEENFLEKIRAVKSRDEASAIARACEIADRALKDIVPLITPGVSERDLVTELDYRMKKGGAEDVAFETMVLFGARASQPHATPMGGVRLAPGDFILIDFGACFEGYRSDMTRTFVCGKASAEQARAYDTVLLAGREAVKMVVPGANGRDINRRALEIIKGEGYPAFEYGVGHGVGLEIHEEPFMRQTADVILKPGMVLTIEPGIYVPGWGGIRIEDTLLVTEGGSESLSGYPRELTELQV